MNTTLKLLAKDLTKDDPRSPRETLAGYVIAARTLDKCRAVGGVGAVSVGRWGEPALRRVRLEQY